MLHWTDYKAIFPPDQARNHSCALSLQFSLDPCGVGCRVLVVVTKKTSDIVIRRLKHHFLEADA